MKRPIYSIWVQQDQTDEGTLDFNVWVWDETENERAEELERYGFLTVETALRCLEQTIEAHPEIQFISHPSEKLVIFR